MDVSCFLVGIVVLFIVGLAIYSALLGLTDVLKDIHNTLKLNITKK